MSQLDLINGKIIQGGESPSSIQQRKKREEEQKKQRKAKHKRPFWKRDWSG